MLNEKGCCLCISANYTRILCSRSDEKAFHGKFITTASTDKQMNLNLRLKSLEKSENNCCLNYLLVLARH